MQFKQSFITIKPRTMSSLQKRPVIIIEQDPSRIVKKQNIGNLANKFRIRGPHSSNSDPLQFLKKKQNNLQKTTSVSSEEQKLKEKIEKLNTYQEKSYAYVDTLNGKYKNYQERSLEALQRGDQKMVTYFQPLMQRCMRQIQEQGRMMREFIAERRELSKQLEKLRAERI